MSHESNLSYRVGGCLAPVTVITLITSTHTVYLTQSLTSKIEKRIRNLGKSILFAASEKDESLNVVLRNIQKTQISFTQVLAIILVEKYRPL
jgi:hypothetical protein